jgi:hypothetical protein
MRLRLLAVVMAVLLILVVVWQVARRGETVAARGCATTQTVVNGIVGSEKEAFLRDPRVVDAFRCAGFTLRIDADGSRDMVSRVASGYDFAFPSSTPTAEKIMQARGVTESYRPFSSVMAVATWKPTVDVLRKAGVVETVKDREVVSIRKLVEMSERGTTWKKINDGSPNGNVVMLRTTDPADSNSAIMFLSIASAVLNDDRPVSGADTLPGLLPDLCRLVLDQGTKPNTSGVLFEEYLTGGAERIPMALVYESQFLDTVSGQKVPAGGDHVLLFPNPTVYAWHTLVPLTPAGSDVGKLLRDDESLKDVAAGYGFRPQGRTLADRPNPPVVVEPPDYQVLELMLDRLAEQREAAQCPK